MARNSTIITNFTNQYSENLLPNYYGTINKTVGTATITYQTKSTFKSDKCIKIVHTDTLNNVFNFGTYGFTAKENGSHIFSYKFFKDQAAHSVDFKVNVFVNGLLLADNTLNQTLHNTAQFKDTSYNTFAQTLQLLVNDEVTFTFESQSNTTGTILYFDALKVEYDNKFLSIPTPYSLPLPEQSTGWQSITDTINTQAIVANTETQIIFTGLEQQNGDLDFLDNTGVITPLQVNDTLTIDVAFSFVVPSGTTNYFSFYIKIDGIVFRGLSVPMIRSTGDVQYFSQSYTLPVSTGFIGNVARCYINSNAGITLSNRYISVLRTHKAKK